MQDEIQCWRCGISAAEWPLPLGRHAACTQCRADLHVCRMCRFYDRSKAKCCNEPMADEVQNKERANFCGYFTAKPRAYTPTIDASALARANLDALFSGTKSVKNTDNVPDGALTPAERARRDLENLFKKDK